MSGEFLVQEVKLRVHGLTTDISGGRGRATNDDVEVLIIPSNQESLVINRWDIRTAPCNTYDVFICNVLAHTLDDFASLGERNIQTLYPVHQIRLSTDELQTAVTHYLSQVARGDNEEHPPVAVVRPYVSQRS